MPASLRLHRTIKKEIERSQEEFPATGVVYAVNGNTADIRVGHSPTLMRNVRIIGNPETLMIGQEVLLHWTEQEGSYGPVPVIFITGDVSGDVSTVAAGRPPVDNRTIIYGPYGLSVKAAGIGLQHLNFIPALEGHTHLDSLERSGWQVKDGVIFKGHTFIHPDGQISLGAEPNLLKLDSKHATYRLWVGSVDPADAKFSVSKDGAIHAALGDIGGWSIGDDEIVADGGSVGMRSRAPQGSPEWRFWAGGPDPATAPFRVNSEGDVWMDKGHVAVTLQSTNYQPGLTGWFLDPQGFAEFGDVRVRGAIRSAVLEYNSVTATAGTLGVFKSAGVLAADATATEGYFDILIEGAVRGAPIIAKGDYLQIKDGEKAAFLRVSGETDPVLVGDKVYRYSVCLTNGSEPDTFTAGTTVIRYGQEGDGFIYLSADGTVGEAPALVMGIIEKAEPWAQKTYVYAGNLHGYDKNLTGMGMVLGDMSGGSDYLLYNSSDGALRLKGNVLIGADIDYWPIRSNFYLQYDGPELFLNFTGSLNTASGQEPVIANGGLIFQKGKYGKAIQTGLGRRNYFTNPAFGYDLSDPSEWFYGWSKGKDLVVEYTSDSNNVLFGWRSAHITRVSTGSNYSITQNLSLDTSVYTISAYVKREDGAPITTSDVRLFFQQTRTVNIAHYQDDWYLVWYTGNGTGAEASYGIAAPQLGVPIIVAGVQIEQTAYPTPFIAGDLGQGHSWTGTPYKSDCTRTNTHLVYEYNMPEKFTVSFWYRPWVGYGEAGTTLWVFTWRNDTTGDMFGLTHANSGIAVRWYIGGANQVTMNAVDLERLKWHHIAATYDGSVLKFYVNGQFIGAQEVSKLPSVPNRIGVGCYTTGANPISGLIDDLCVSTEVLSDFDVQKIYTSEIPIVIGSGSGGLVISSPGAGRIVGTSDSLTATTHDGKNVFALANMHIGSYAGFTNVNAGDLIIGHNAGGSSAIYWNKSNGTFGFYGGGNTEPTLEIDKAGNLLAGRGNVRLGLEGVTFGQDDVTGGSTTIRWIDSSVMIAMITARQQYRWRGYPIEEYLPTGVCDLYIGSYAAPNMQSYVEISANKGDTHNDNTATILVYSGGIDTHNTSQVPRVVMHADEYWFTSRALQDTNVYIGQAQGTRGVLHLSGAPSGNNGGSIFFYHSGSYPANDGWQLQCYNDQMRMTRWEGGAAQRHFIFYADGSFSAPTRLLSGWLNLQDRTSMGTYYGTHSTIWSSSVDRNLYNRRSDGLVVPAFASEINLPPNASYYSNMSMGYILNDPARFGLRFDNGEVNYCEWTVLIPDAWTGRTQLELLLGWSPAEAYSGGGNVYWGVEVKVNVGTPTYGTSQAISCDGTVKYNASRLTFAVPALARLSTLHIRLVRWGTNASDTMERNVILFGAKLGVV